MKQKYDIIVVGGGHAGCEAAAVAAGMGSRTLLITSDMTKFASMSCNPAIGGIAKGQIVREIDALGGYIGIVTDRTSIQFRMLNRSKGPAMWSPRSQCDRFLFCAEWRSILESIPCLFLWQDTVNRLLIEGDKVVGVRTVSDVELYAGAVILTTGTFMSGVIHVGRSQTDGGRIGEPASYGVTEQLTLSGFETGRMKTGTPARLDGRTIDFSAMQEQPGDDNPGKTGRRFSFMPGDRPLSTQRSCYITYTSEEVHDILRSGFDDSPMYGGRIKGIGPRYCPSIEDKIKTFSDKDRHHLFIEPEGVDTCEYYVNGFSSSLPADVQLRGLRKVKGLEKVEIFRPGYAVEYDYFPPTQLNHSLETKRIKRLFFAGQVNGTTGYEEAAAQGMMAGINAHRTINGENPVVLRRDEAYIGVLIDDLVVKGVDEPYRMFTSRAEYRMLLRQDNADFRLTELGRKSGTVTDERYKRYTDKKEKVSELCDFIRQTSVRPDEINDYLSSVNSSPLTQSKKIIDVLLRPDISLFGLLPYIDVFGSETDKFRFDDDLKKEIIESAEIHIKYEGYIERENRNADKLKRLEEIRIPDGFDYSKLNALSTESRQKLSRIAPKTIGQASRIPGVSPSDISILLVFFGR